jgi:hypothetical protein
MTRCKITGCEAYESALKETEAILNEGLDRFAKIEEARTKVRVSPEAMLVAELRSKISKAHGAGVPSAVDLFLSSLSNTIGMGEGFKAVLKTGVIALSAREETFPAYEAAISVIRAESGFQDVSSILFEHAAGLSPALRAGLGCVESPLTLAAPVVAGGIFGRGAKAAVTGLLGKVASKEGVVGVGTAIGLGAESAGFVATHRVKDIATSNTDIGALATETLASSGIFGGLKLFGAMGGFVKSVMPETHLGVAVAKTARDVASVTGLASMDKLQVASGIAPNDGASYEESLLRAFFVTRVLHGVGAMARLDSVRSTISDIKITAQRLVDAMNAPVDALLQTAAASSKPTKRDNLIFSAGDRRPKESGSTQLIPLRSIQAARTGIMAKVKSWFSNIFAPKDYTILRIGDNVYAFDDRVKRVVVNPTERSAVPDAYYIHSPSIPQSFEMIKDVSDGNRWRIPEDGSLSVTGKKVKREIVYNATPEADIMETTYFPIFLSIGPGRYKINLDKNLPTSDPISVDVKTRLPADTPVRRPNPENFKNVKRDMALRDHSVEPASRAQPGRIKMTTPIGLARVKRAAKTPTTVSEKTARSARLIRQALDPECRGKQILYATFDGDLRLIQAGQMEKVLHSGTSATWRFVIQYDPKKGWSMPDAYATPLGSAKGRSLFLTNSSDAQMLLAKLNKN